MHGEVSELAEGARLEIVCTVYSGTEGSNPSLSAILTDNPYREMREAGRQERCQPRQAREGAAVTVASGCLASLKGVG